MIRLIRNRTLRVCIAFALGLTTVSGTYADPPAPEAVDAALQQLLKLDPPALAARLKELKAELAAAEAAAKDASLKAETAEKEAKALEARIAAVLAGAEALAGLTGEKTAGAMAAGGGGEMMAEAKPAADAPKKPTVNYTDHILPIFRARCFSCHNEDRRRGGLALTTVGLTLEGGSSGPVIEPGAPDSSRLLRLVSGEEEPKMPPSGEPLSAEELEKIRTWISEGAPANADAQVMTAKSKDTTDVEVYIAAKMDGPPPMPEAPLAPAVTTPREGLVARAVAASPGAPLVAVGGDGQVLLYRLDDFSLLGALPFPEGYVYSVSFSVNGHLLVCAGGQEGAAGVVAVYDVKSGERTGVYGETWDTILTADISPDHRMLAVGGPDRKVKVYDTASGEQLFALDAHTDWVLAVKYSPDGELLASADRGGGLYLWQAANGRPVEQLRGHEGAIFDLAYTYDSVLLASAGADGSVQTWDTWKYSRVRNIGNAHAGGALSVDYANDGRLVTTGQDGEVKVWGNDGKVAKAYEPLEDWGYAASFGGDGALVLAGSWQGRIAVWDAESGERRATLSTVVTE